MDVEASFNSPCASNLHFSVEGRPPGGSTLYPGQYYILINIIMNYYFAMM